MSLCSGSTTSNETSENIQQIGDNEYVFRTGETPEKSSRKQNKSKNKKKKRKNKK